MKKLLREFNQAGGVREFILPVLCGGWFVYMIVASFSLRKLKTDRVGSGAMPRMVAALGLVCILVIICPRVVAMVRGLLRKDEADAEARDKVARVRPPPLQYLREHYAQCSFVLIVLYVLGMRQLGFIIASTLYLYLQIVFICPAGKFRPLWYLLLSAGFPILLYFVFLRGFSIILPPGPLQF